MRQIGKNYDIIKMEVKKMEGINFMVDKKGKKVAVLIDIRKYGKIWEDIYDVLIAKKRKNEPRETLESVKERLHKQGKLSG